VVILSELFTNALLHTASGKPGGLVVVQVSRWRHGVRIAVTDQGSSGQPVIRDPSASAGPAENGNGLYLVAHLAGRLDWHDDASGRTIAAILGQLPPQPRPCTQAPGPASPPGFRGLPDQRTQHMAWDEVPLDTGAGMVTVAPGRALIALFKELTSYGVPVAGMTLTRLQGMLMLEDGRVVAYRCGWLIWPAGRASRRGRPLQTLHSARGAAGAARRLTQLVAATGNRLPHGDDR